MRVQLYGIALLGLIAVSSVRADDRELVGTEDIGYGIIHHYALDGGERYTSEIVEKDNPAELPAGPEESPTEDGDEDVRD